jgi:hypothetical protein
VGVFSDIISRKAIGAHGQDLARQFASRLTKERLGDAKRVEAEFQIMSGNALGYHRKANLGIFGTSHLVNSFQWALIEDGYPSEFARDIGNQLAVKLAAGE